LFSDAGSVTPKSNPFSTDASGYGSFYAVNERYRIQATDIDWRDEDLISQPDLAASLAAISTNTSDISTNTSDILERAELSGGPLANFTAMPQVGGDPIVESGSNADGEWTRWADGTQTCTSAGVTLNSSTTAGSTSGIRLGGAAPWTFPISFIVAPTANPTLLQVDSGSTNASFCESQSGTVSTVSVSFVAFSTQGATVQVSMEGFAIGRWK
jgi:hypothetical protein